MTMRTELVLRNKSLAKDDIFAIESILIEVGDKEDEFRSYESNALTIKVDNQGNICLYDDRCDGIIWIDKLQLEHIHEAVTLAQEAYLRTK